MSERQEKKKRYFARLAYIAAFDKWMAAEPPLITLVRWHRWKKARPIWKEPKDD